MREAFIGSDQVIFCPLKLWNTNFRNQKLINAAPLPKIVSEWPKMDLKFWTQLEVWNFVIENPPPWVWKIYENFTLLFLTASLLLLPAKSSEAEQRDVMNVSSTTKPNINSILICRIIFQRCVMFFELKKMILTSLNYQRLDWESQHHYFDVQFFSCWHWLCAGWRDLNVYIYIRVTELAGGI